MAKKVLVAFNPKVSTAALDCALALAKPAGAKLLCQLYEGSSSPGLKSSLLGWLRMVAPQPQGLVSERVAPQGPADEAIRRRLAQEGLQADISTPRGRVVQSILSAANEADMIVVGPINNEARLDNRINRRLARQLAKPLLLAPERCDKISSPVLCYDGSRSARKALTAAADVALALGVPLEVVYLASAFDKGDGLAEAKRYLKERQVPFTTTLLVGLEPEVLLRYAAREGHDLIVLGGAMHSALKDWWEGCTARTVLKKCNKPVLLNH